MEGKTLTAFTRHSNPLFRSKQVVHLQPSFFIMDKRDKDRFGNLVGKLESVANDLTNDRLHHYTIA